MKIKHAKPMNLSDIPFAMVVVAFLLILIPVRCWKLWQLSIMGWLILFASWGTSVEIEEGVLVLRYFFGKLPIKVEIDKIEEVKIVNRLERATLVRHFPWMAALFLAVILYATADFILLPKDMLRGYYYGDLGLIVFGMAYLGAWALPFKKERYASFFAAFSVILGASLLWVKTGAFEGEDAFFVLTWVVLLSLMFAEYYSRDYVLIKTPRRIYLIASERGENIKVLLGGMINVQAS